jgi:hypothetical protein
MYAYYADDPPNPSMQQNKAAKTQRRKGSINNSK